MTVQGPSTFRDAWRAALATWHRDRGTERVWTRDASLWTDTDEGSWLGWLDAPGMTGAELDELQRRTSTIAGPDISDVLLIGIGGSSLAANVIANCVPAALHTRSLRLLDSTEPSTVRAALARTRWERTLTIVASKSGTTLEPNLLLAAAMDAASTALGAQRAAMRFVAITDPGTALEKRAHELGFAHVFHGNADIGGRYSALSAFGLAPASFLGLNLREFMAGAREMADACRRAPAENAGVQLGVYLGVAARAGRDKCTLALPDSLAALGGWIEQLIAESTGKNGAGVLPIDGEALRGGESYSADRAFVHLRDTPGGAKSDAARVLIEAGFPVFSIDVATPPALAAEFFRWEFATAVAGSMLQVNPFNQPDVEAAKSAARALTDARERGDTLPPVDVTPLSELQSVLSRVIAPRYVAFLAYLAPTPETVEALQATRARIRDARRVATMLGFGPQYLHSTGQAFKGGAPNGVFILVTCDAQDDVAVPGRNLTFGTVLSAQAAGDEQVLRQLGRTVLHVHLRGELRAALRDFDDAVASAFA